MKISVCLLSSVSFVYHIFLLLYSIRLRYRKVKWSDGDETIDHSMRYSVMYRCLLFHLIRASLNQYNSQCTIVYRKRLCSNTSRLFLFSTYSRKRDIHTRVDMKIRCLFFILASFGNGSKEPMRTKEEVSAPAVELEPGRRWRSLCALLAGEPRDRDHRARPGDGKRGCVRTGQCAAIFFGFLHW